MMSNSNNFKRGNDLNSNQQNGTKFPRLNNMRGGRVGGRDPRGVPGQNLGLGRGGNFGRGGGGRGIAPPNPFAGVTRGGMMGAVRGGPIGPPQSTGPMMGQTRSRGGPILHGPPPPPLPRSGFVSNMMMNASQQSPMPIQPFGMPQQPPPPPPNIVPLGPPSRPRPGTGPLQMQSSMMGAPQSHPGMIPPQQAIVGPPPNHPFPMQQQGFPPPMHQPIRHLPQHMPQQQVPFQSMIQHPQPQTPFANASFNQFPPVQSNPSQLTNSFQLGPHHPQQGIPMSESQSIDQRLFHQANNLYQPPSFATLTQSQLVKPTPSLNSQAPASTLQMNFSNSGTPTAGLPDSKGTAASLTSDAGHMWSEHISPEGQVYYFNQVTKESVWARPAEMGPAKIATVASAPAAVTAAPLQQEQVKREWKEYYHPETKTVYYSDGVLSVWEKPPELISKEKNTKPTVSGTESANYSKKEDVPEYDTKEEADAAFVELLASKAITPTTKWPEVVKLCSNDTRWTACCQTNGQRKQILAEFQTKKQKEEKEQRRQELAKARKGFTEMLMLKVPQQTILGAPAANLAYLDIRDRLLTDSRFFAIEDEDLRQELFYDYVEETKKREERIKATKKKEVKDGFFAFLKEKEEAGVLSHSSTWASFRSSLGPSDQQNPRFLVNENMTDLDRQVFFADFVMELQAQHEEKLRRIREAQLRAEKAQRDAYRDMLAGLARQGILTISSRWGGSLLDQVRSDPTYGPVAEQGRDEPRILLEDFVEDMRDVYFRDKPFLIDLLQIGNFERTITEKTTYEEFRDALLKAAGLNLIADCKRVLNREPISSAILTYHELIQRAKIGALVVKRRPILPEESEDEGEIVEE